MKVGHDVDLFGRHILTATPGDYDATPTLPMLSINSWPHELSSSRLALALALCYLNSTSGALDVEAKFTPASAERLRDIYPHRPILPGPIDYTPTEIPRWHLRTRVTTHVDTDPGGSHDNMLHLLPADRFTGQMTSTRSLWLSSNATWSSLSELTREDFHRILSVMVLFSEDMNTHTFDLADDIVPREVDLNPYNRILRTVGLSVDRSKIS